MNPAMPFDSDKVHRVYRPQLKHGHELPSILAAAPVLQNPFAGIQNMMMDGFQECYRKVDNLELRGMYA